MQENFFSERLARLRSRKNVSAREMSLAIGQNRNYINQIENRKMYPTMQVFFVICEYLGVSAHEFFDEENLCPEQLRGLTENLKHLDCETLYYISGLVKSIRAKMAGVSPEYRR